MTNPTTVGLADVLDAPEAAPVLTPTPSATNAVAVRDTSTQAVALVDSVMDIAEAEENRVRFAPDALSIPFIKLVQSNSPELNSQSAKYNPGARAGMFVNSITGELYDTERVAMHVIPVIQVMSVTEWIPRNDDGSGGGFVKDHGTNQALFQQTTRNVKNRDILPSGNELVRSLMYYLTIVDLATGRATNVIYAGQRTAIKHLKKWNSAIEAVSLPSEKRPGQYFTPPMYYCMWDIKTVRENKGNLSWFVPSISKDFAELPKYHVDVNGTPVARGSQLFLEAHSFAKSIKDGQVKTDFSTLVDDDDVQVSEVGASDGGADYEVTAEERAVGNDNKLPFE